MAGVRHIVMFRFAPSASQARIDAIVAAFAALKGKVPGISGFSWGTNNSPEGLNKGLTHCFVVEFPDAAARDAYLPHPEHDAFVKFLGDDVADVCVFDYSDGR
ncbi:MAG: Dabb family protein [Alphaproteobacteria bacterium]